MNANGKWWVVGIVAVVILAVGGGIWMANKNSKTRKLENSKLETPMTASPAPTPEAVTGNVVEVTVEGSNYKFSPTTITALRGDTVRLTFKSMGGIHNLVIDQFEVETSQLGEGEEEEVEFVADKMGGVEDYCAIANHKAMGMVGKLIVGGQ